MAFDFSNFLIFERNHDFFIYNKCTSYLYPIDQLHYEIARFMQENSHSLKLPYIANKFSNCSLSSVKGHYKDIIKIFSMGTSYCCTPSRFSLSDITYSIAKVPQIVIEVTEQCNLQCKYCYYGKMYHNSGTRDTNMNTEHCLLVLREILSERNYLFNNVVVSFYGGEPLLNFNLIRSVVLFCKNEFPNLEYTFNITTNGTLLLKHINFLEEYNFRTLISLDGNENDNVNRVYKNAAPTFNDVNHIIEHIFQQHHNYFEKNVNFISVLHEKSNILSICKYFSKFNKTPMLTMLSLEEINESQQIVYPYKGVKKNEMSKLYKSNHDIYQTIQDASESDKLAELKTEMPLSACEKPLRGCDLFSNKIFLAANEQIYLCEKSSRRFPFGNFKNGKLLFYTDSINEYYMSIYKSFNKVCSDCATKMLCKKCFFAEPSLMSGNTICKSSDSKLTLKLINTISND